MTPDLMLPKIVWLREQEPAHHARTCWFATSNDFLVHRLTGEMATDPTNATKYLYGETDGTGYPAGLLSALDVDVATLPPVVRGGSAVLTLRPELRERFGLHPDIRVVLSTYDAICAVYGSGVAAVGEACDVSGTVTSFRAVTDRSDRDPAGRLFTTVAHRAGPLPRGRLQQPRRRRHRMGEAGPLPGRPDPLRDDGRRGASTHRLAPRASPSCRTCSVSGPRSGTRTRARSSSVSGATTAGPT